ncbi:hypothetical protein BDF22DRAFT_406123 [Syncephalis plumigaleata]|nr:hypothetical protein BDF22DRAFT_406123 [Syncephalis plumigaleata]
MTTGSTNYSNVHSTDPKITSGTGSAPQVGNYMLNNEATTVAGVASTTHIDSTRQNRVNHAYKVVGEGSGNPAMSAQAPLSHSSHSSGPIPSAQVMPIHGSYRRVQTNYPQAPTAQQLEAQRRPSQPVALSHIPPYWRSPAAAPLPAGHNHNHNNNNTSNHGHGHPTTTYNQASRPPYSTSPNTQNGYTGNAPSSSKPKAPLLASRELSDQVHYSNIPKSLVSPPPQPSSSASSSSPSHHIYTGPRTTASAAAGRGRAPLPRGFKAPVAGDTSPKIEPATIGYHTPGMRQRSLSTDATASRMPYLRPIDGSRARFNISDSSLVREDGERQVVNPPDNHQYRYPGTIERPTLAPMGTVNAPSTYDSAMRDDEWPPGSFGHGPLATNSNKSSTGRSKPPPTSIPRITTVNNEPSPSTASPIGMAISNAFAQWHHSSRNSTPSPSASPSSSVVNSPVDSRASPARMLPAYPAMTGSPGTMRPSNHHAPPLPPPPPRQSGPMATFGRIMSRSKQQQQQQQQPQQPQTVPEKVETTKSTSSHTGYHEFNQNPFYFATSIGTFMKIEKPSSSSSTNKLKVNTQMASSQQGDQPRRHSDAGLTHRSQMSVESVPATVNEENEQSISPCAPSAPIERSTPWFDYNTVKHSNPNKVRAAIRQRSMGDFKAGRNARDYDKSTHGLDSSLPRLKTSTPTSIPTSSASAHTGSPHTMHPHHYPPHHFTSNGSGNNNKASPSSMRALPTSTRSGLATTNLANESPRLAGGESLHRDNNNNMLSGDVSPLLAAMPAPVPGAWTTRVPRPLSPSRDALATAATAATMTKLPTAIARPNGDISLSSSDIHNEIKSIVNQDNADKSKPTVYYGKNIAKQVKVKHANVQLQSLNVKLLPNQHLKSRAQYHMNNAETTQANHQLTTCNGEPGTQAFMRRQSTLRSVRSDESLISRITPSSSMEGASRDNMLGWSANPDNAGTQGLPMVNLNSGMFTAQTVRASSIRRTPSTSKPNSLWAKKPKHLQTVARVLSSSPEPMPGPSGNHLPGSPTKTTAMAMATATNTSSITASGMFMEQPAITKLRPWSERPSTDEISQNLDRYFPDHDLDRPIMDPVDEDEEGVSDDELNSSDPTQAEINVELFISHSRRPSETINSGCNSNAASTAHSTDNASSSSPSLMYSDPSRSGHDNQSTVTFADNMYNNEADDQMYDSLDTDSASALAARRAHYKLRRVANRKSIRVVVQEAQQRSQAAWVSPVIPVFSSPLAAAAAVVSSSSLTSDQAAQSTELNDLGHNSDESNSDTEKSPRRITPIRRRSTMLWGSRVAELPKNGSNRIRRRDRVRPRLPLALPEEMGKHSNYKDVMGSWQANR